MTSRVARIGALAGWLSLLGIFGYHILLQALFGPRVSGTVDAAQITAFYRHDLIAPLGIEQFLVVVPVLVFAVAVRETLVESAQARLWATVGLAFMVVEIPLIITQIAAQAALVTVAGQGGDVVPLFRFWDVLYNSGTYVLEAALLISFGLAFRSSSSFPSWLAGLSFVAGIAVSVNVLAIWVGIPDPATLPANLLFGAWFAGVSISLGRLASRPTGTVAAAPGMA